MFSQGWKSGYESLVFLIRSVPPHTFYSFLSQLQFHFFFLFESYAHKRLPIYAISLVIARFKARQFTS